MVFKLQKNDLIKQLYLSKPVQRGARPNKIILRVVQVDESDLVH